MLYLLDIHAGEKLHEKYFFLSHLAFSRYKDTHITPLSVSLQRTKYNSI